MARSSQVLDVRRAVLAGVMVLICACFAFIAAAPVHGASNPVSGAKKDEGFQTAVPHAILIDAETGTVLFEKAADQPTPPSSLAKLMTAELVFREITEGRLQLDDEFVISENAWRRGGAPSHTSSMFAAIHSRVKVRDLILGMIVQSGNDACIALAEGVAGNESAFAAAMNKRARELGLTKSYFSNATGLPDPSMKATVRDLAKLARHIVRTYPEFYKFYNEREFTWNKIRQTNRNPLLALSIGADGMKTGYTEDGGYGLVGSALQNGLRLIVVVNGSKSAKERADEAKKLLDWGFHGFEARPLFADRQIVGEAKLFGGAQGRLPLVAPGAVSILVPRNSGDRIVAKIFYRGPIPAPVQQGQPIGTLRVFRGDAVALEVPLQASQSVEKGNLPRRAMDAASELVINWLRAGFSRLSKNTRASPDT